MVFDAELEQLGRLFLTLTRRTGLDQDATGNGTANRLRDASSGLMIEAFDERLRFRRRCQRGERILVQLIVEGLIGFFLDMTELATIEKRAFGMLAIQ